MRQLTKTEITEMRCVSETGRCGGLHTAAGGSDRTSVRRVQGKPKPHAVTHAWRTQFATGSTAERMLR